MKYKVALYIWNDNGDYNADYLKEFSSKKEAISWVENNRDKIAKNEKKNLDGVEHIDINIEEDGAIVYTTNLWNKENEEIRTMIFKNVVIDYNDEDVEDYANSNECSEELARQELQEEADEIYNNTYELQIEGDFKDGDVDYASQLSDEIGWLIDRYSCYNKELEPYLDRKVGHNLTLENYIEKEGLEYCNLKEINSFLKEDNLTLIKANALKKDKKKEKEMER